MHPKASQRWMTAGLRVGYVSCKDGACNRSRGWPRTPPPWGPCRYMHPLDQHVHTATTNNGHKDPISDCPLTSRADQTQIQLWLKSVTATDTVIGQDSEA